jgi:hypothetical protein
MSRKSTNRRKEEAPKPEEIDTLNAGSRLRELLGQDEKPRSCRAPVFSRLHQNVDVRYVEQYGSIRGSRGG